jgi:signal transduction histidine kinase
MVADGWVRLRPRSVRVRATLGAVLVVGAATLLGAVLLVGVLAGLLADEIASATQTRAAQMAAAVRPAPQPAALAIGDLDDDVAQVVRWDGTVLAASANIAGRGPIAWPLPVEPVEMASPVGGERRVVVVAAPVPADPMLTVLAARSLDARDDAVEFVTQLLAIGLPALVLVVAVLCWVVVGRALAPVEAVRREVDEISSAVLDRRVSVPPGADEIARLSATMNRMLDRLERAQRRQRQFVSDASHELRSPITAIRQHAEVAARHPDRTTVPELARTVLDEGLRVQDLVEDMLLLARADESSLALRTVPVDLDDLVFEEARRLRRAGDVRIDTSAVSAGRVVGDAAALGRVLRNLGENARRHARSRVAFGLRESADGVELLVDDDGPGIPPAERDRVRRRFVRLDEARDRDHGGSGLGLAIVAELLAAHGGDLAIEESPGGGARMRVRLPPPFSPRSARPVSNHPVG